MNNLAVKKERRISDALLIGIFMLGVIFLRLFYITRTTGPFIYADELGYWSHAAHMTGHTWAGVMNGVSWYSFGYSFWLALTFLFSDRMIVMYRIAIILNVMMNLGIYLLAFQIIRKLAREQEIITSGLIAFAATCFPTYIFYSYTTMCETALALAIWFLFYETVSLEEKPRWWKGALLGITAGYTYMVHNRSLTVVLAVGVCLILLEFRHKIDWKIMVSFAVSLLVAFLFYAFVKDYLESVIVQNQVVAETQTAIERGTANTYGKMWQRLLSIFKAENIIRPFLSLMGQMWQCLSSTYLLAGLGAVYAVRQLGKNVKDGQNISIYAYPVLALLFSVGLTSVAALGPRLGTTGRVRIDAAFYGRYNECYFPLLIMMALLVFCEGQMQGALKTLAGTVFVYLALSVGMSFRLYGMDGYLNIVSAVSIHIFHWLGEFSVWKCTGIALLGCGIIVGLCCFKRVGNLGRYAGMTILVALFSTTALYCMRTSIRGENDYTMQYAPLYDYLNENTEKGEIVYMTTGGKPAYDLQSRLVDKSAVVILPETLDAAAKGSYVVINEEELTKAPVVDYEICMQCEEFVVIRLH